MSSSRRLPAVRRSPSLRHPTTAEEDPEDEPRSDVVPQVVGGGLRKPAAIRPQGRLLYARVHISLSSSTTIVLGWKYGDQRADNHDNYA